MAPVKSMKCISRPPNRLPNVLASLGRTISVISDWVLATVRTIGLSAVEPIFCLVPFLRSRQYGVSLASYNHTGGREMPDVPVPVSAIHANYANLEERRIPNMSSIDKMAGLKEILAMDPKNSFARYGIAMELAGQGNADAAL